MIEHSLQTLQGCTNFNRRDLSESSSTQRLSGVFSNKGGLELPSSPTTSEKSSSMKKTSAHLSTLKETHASCNCSCTQVLFANKKGKEITTEKCLLNCKEKLPWAAAIRIRKGSSMSTWPLTQSYRPAGTNRRRRKPGSETKRRAELVTGKDRNAPNGCTAPAVRSAAGARGTRPSNGAPAPWGPRPAGAACF